MAFHSPTYVSGTSPVHRCDARVKIAALLVFSIAVLAVPGWWAVAVFFATVATAILVARIPLRNVATMLVPVYALAFFSALFNVVADPSVSRLVAGLYFAVRMIVLVAGSFVVCLTSAPSDLLEAFRWFIGPLRRIGVPVDDIAFTLALSLRFIPLIEREFESVRTAQKARGADLSGSFGQKLRIWGNAFSAVFVGLFRHADAVAEAMDARCYGATPIRTRLPKK